MSRPDVRREQVADAVLHEIATHGLRSVALARIATHIGLTIGSIRHYVGDTLREVMRFTLSVLTQRDDPAARITGVIAFAAPTSDQGPGRTSRSSSTASWRARNRSLRPTSRRHLFRAQE